MSCTSNTNIRRSRSSAKADRLVLRHGDQDSTQDISSIRQKDFIYMQLIRWLKKLFLAAVEVVVTDVEHSINGGEDGELPVSIHVDAGWMVQGSMGHDCVPVMFVCIRIQNGLDRFKTI